MSALSLPPLLQSWHRHLDYVEAALNYKFHDRKLLLQAFVHRSFVFENPEVEIESNERLEFLGDAVLDFVVADYLFREYPDRTEGELTLLRAAMVRLETLAAWAKDLALGQALLLGKGEDTAGGRARTANLGRCFEALIAALYIDGGLEPVRALVLPRVAKALGEGPLPAEIKDAKSRLQELIQKEYRITPRYHTVSAKGPDHARWFTVQVLVGSQVLAAGEGPSKTAAQQKAAEAALEKLARGELTILGSISTENENHIG